MKNLLFILLLAAMAALVTLAGCPAPETRARGINLKLNIDSLNVGNDYQGQNTFWSHPVNNDSVIFSWGLDSVITTYDKLSALNVDLPAGSYQFKIYPMKTPVYSDGYLWKWQFKSQVNEAHQILLVWPTSDYALILLDTTSVLNFNRPNQKIRNGYYYEYVRADVGRYEFTYTAGPDSGGAIHETVNDFYPETYKTGVYGITHSISGGVANPITMKFAGQVFQAKKTGAISRAAFNIYKVTTNGEPAGEVISYLFKVSGTPGIDAKPAAGWVDLLAESNPFNAVNLSTNSAAIVNLRFEGEEKYVIDSGQWYGIAAYYNGTGQIMAGLNNRGATAGQAFPDHAGNAFHGGIDASGAPAEFVVNPDFDRPFYVYTQQQEDNETVTITNSIDSLEANNIYPFRFNEVWTVQLNIDLKFSMDIKPMVINSRLE